MTYAYATLVTNADYALGATALARSLKAAGSSAPLLVMATGHAVESATHELAALEAFNVTLLPVPPLPVSKGFREKHIRKEIHSRAPFNKGKKPSFHEPLDNFCKLWLWQQTAYDRIVFLDADTIVIQNVDQLFKYPEFSAAPNLYESLADMHRLNSGVFVATPNTSTFDDMLQVLDQPGAFWPRTDQTFLESYFPNWHGLPYTFNVMQYLFFNLPALWHWPSIKILHYQYEKPWDLQHGKTTELGPLIDLWKTMFETGELPQDLPLPPAAATFVPGEQ